MKIENRKFILLIHPHNSLAPEGDQEYYPNPPLGLMILSSVLKMHGYLCDILDLRMTEVDESPIIRLKEYLNNLALPPLIIGISIYTENFSDALSVAETAKRIHPNTKIVLGGYHATFCYKECLKYPSVDFVVIGEGESTLIELLEHIKCPGRFSLNKIKGHHHQNLLPHKISCRFPIIIIVSIILNMEILCLSFQAEAAQGNVFFVHAVLLLAASIVVILLSGFFA